MTMLEQKKVLLEGLKKQVEAMERVQRTQELLELAERIDSDTKRRFRLEVSNHTVALFNWYKDVDEIHCYGVFSTMKQWLDLMSMFAIMNTPSEGELEAMQQAETSKVKHARGMF